MRKTPEAETASAGTADREKEPGGLKRLFLSAKRSGAGKAGFRRPRRLSPKKAVLLAVILAAAAGGGYGVYRLFFYEEPVQIVTGTTVRGSITTTIEGTAMTKPATFQRLTVPVGGEVREVFVKQGDTVKVGDPLYTVYSEDLEGDIAALESTIEDYREQLEELSKKASSTQITAPFAGKLVNVQVEDGDEVNESSPVATLVDDSKMLLELYFSTAYAGEIREGMKASVSIPSRMAELEGTVAEVSGVSYVTSEGAECFKVKIAVDNPGTLTKGLEATAAVESSSGEAISPAGSGALEYCRTKAIKAGASGTIALKKLEESMRVSGGDLLAVIENDDYAGQISALEKKINSAELNLQKLYDSLDACSATAEVEGTVVFVDIEPGDEVTAGTTALAIYNTDTMVIEAQIGEADSEYVKLGMEVAITKSGSTGDQTFTGKVTEVSLEGTASNGVAYFPTTITIDSGGKLSAGVYVTYKITAAQASDVVLAPIAAVKRTAAGTCLFVKADSKPENAVDLEEGVVPEGFYAVPVETGLSDDKYVEIKSGVGEGVTVFEQYISKGSGVSGSDKTSQTSDNSFGAMPGQMPGYGQMPQGGQWQGGGMPGRMG